MRDNLLPKISIPSVNIPRVFASSLQHTYCEFLAGHEIEALPDFNEVMQSIEEKERRYLEETKQVEPYQPVIKVRKRFSLGDME